MSPAVNIEPFRSPIGHDDDDACLGAVSATDGDDVAELDFCTAVVMHLGSLALARASHNASDPPIGNSLAYSVSPTLHKTSCPTTSTLTEYEKRLLSPIRRQST